jgi:chromosome segregation ATPase
MKKTTQMIFSLVFIFAFAGMASISIAQTDGSDLQNSLSQLRGERQAFKDEKAKEASEKQLIVKEKVQAKREQAETRRAEAEKKMEEKRKTVLLKLIDVKIKHLDKTNERVQKMPNITEELKAQLTTEIESAKSAIDAKKTEVENTTGKDSIKKLAKEIQDLFRSKRDIVRKIVEAIHASRAEKAVDTADERSAAIKAKIKELNDAGQDTSELETDLSDADNNITKAKDKIKEKVFTDANESLQNAYGKFKDIAKKVEKIK